MEGNNETIDSRIAIRCAKAAILLHALNSSSNRGILKSSEQEEEAMVRREINELKMELAKERIRRKRIKLCGLMEILLQLMLLLFLSTFFLVFLLISS